MVNKKVNSKIVEIIEQLDGADETYYNQGESIISDEEYDHLKDELRQLAPNHPRLNKIGQKVSEVSEWKKAKHKIQMCSQNKVNSIEEFEKWASNTGVDDFIIMEKLDGSSIDLEYQDDILTDAITRGDGIIGESILSNVQRMKNIKKKMNDFDASLRGETLIFSNDFEKVNDILIKQRKKTLANLRNGATGIAKRFDGIFSEYLTILFYDCSLDFATESDKMIWIEKQGLRTCFWKRVNKQQAIEIFNKYQSETRANLDYDIDGMVIRVNDISIQKKLGFVNDNYKGQIAWKFTSMTAIAKVIDVKWSVGSNRRVTPIIYIEPTKIGGVTVRKMNCHNVDIFRKFKLYHGCKLLFKRSNDVIPVPLELVDDND